jgi:hypothetical protein
MHVAKRVRDGRGDRCGLPDADLPEITGAMADYNLLVPPVIDDDDHEARRRGLCGHRWRWTRWWFAKRIGQPIPNCSCL